MNPVMVLLLVNVINDSGSGFCQLFPELGPKKQSQYFEAIRVSQERRVRWSWQVIEEVLEVSEEFVVL